MLLRRVLPAAVTVPPAAGFCLLGLRPVRGWNRGRHKVGAIDTALTRLRDASPALPYTFALAVGLVAALAVAIYLSYWGALTMVDAFNYQSAVVAAQRDAEVLQVSQFERGTKSAKLRAFEKLLESDLARIDAIAASPAERAPALQIPPESVTAFQTLNEQLHVREALGVKRFEDSVNGNVRNRNLSNVLFAVVALLFTFISARLRRRVEEGRTLVDNLKRAFISRRTELPNVKIGSVLISATVGSQIGGDLFDIYSIDGRYGLFLGGDVRRKGVAAAVDTAFIKYAIRTLLSEVKDPGNVLARFSSLYSRNAESDETFVVLFLGIIDTETGEVSYASAGHEPAWLRTEKGVHTLTPTGPLVGVLSDTQYSS